MMFDKFELFADIFNDLINTGYFKNIWDLAVESALNGGGSPLAFVLSFIVTFLTGIFPAAILFFAAIAGTFLPQ